MKRNRLLSGLLSLTMLLPLVPASAFAAEDPAQSGQIVRTSAEQTGEEILENGLLSINKQVLPTGVENQFHIQLDVTTAEDLSQMTLPANAAVLIMVDKSSSVNRHPPILPDTEELREVIDQYDLELSPSDFPYLDDGMYGEAVESLPEVDDFLNDYFESVQPEPMVLSDSSDEYGVQADTVAYSNSLNMDEVRQAIYNCYHRRSWFERKAVLAFMDEYTADDTADRYFAFGSFQQWASIKVPWQKVDKNWHDEDWYHAVADYSSKYEKWNTNTLNNGGKQTYTDGYGSNLEATYLLARNMMYSAFNEDTGTLKDCNIPVENRHVIIISDGEPSNRCSDKARTQANSDHSFTDLINTDKSDPDQSYTDEILSTMEEIAADDSYSIDVVWYGEATLGNSIYLGDGSERFADTFQGADDADLSALGMSGIFEELASIESIVYPWTVTDPMGANIELGEVPASGYNPASAVSAHNNTLRWDLTACQPVDQQTLETETGTRTLSHYQLTYPITLNNRAAGFQSAVPYDTNGATTLAYTVTEKTDSTRTGYTERTASFDIPQVQGYLADVVLQKTDAAGAPLANASFRLTSADGASYTAVSTGSGEVRFSGVPSGYRYTLTETAAPDGYVLSETSYPVQITFGQAAYGETGAPSLTVVNTASTDGSHNNNSNSSSNSGNIIDIEDEPTPLASLDSSDHFAYIIGYPVDYRTGEPTTDKTLWPVRPEQNIDRQEVATIFFRLLTEDSRLQSWSQTNSFPDVESTRWSNNAISTMANAGILSGYTDGTFRPGQPITRAEFAAIAARFDSSLYVGDHQFSDISGHWAAEYIDRAAQKGWVNGYPDGTFRPDQPITRAEAMTLINAVLDRRTHAEDMLDGMIHWPDNDPNAWYYEAVQEATNGHEQDRENPTAYETWTALQPARDWALLEREWSVAAAERQAANSAIA